MEESLDERRKSKRRKSDRQTHIAERFERNSLTKLSILAADYENGHRIFGLRQFLNRLLSISQGYRGSIAILCLEKREHGYHAIYHTMHDPHWKTQFESHLSSYCLPTTPMGGIAGHLYITEENIKDFAFHFTDGIYFCFLQLKFNKNRNNESISFEFIERDTLSRTFAVDNFFGEYKDKDSLLSGLCSSDKLSDEFKSRANKDMWSEGSYVIKETDIKTPNFFGNWKSSWDKKNGFDYRDKNNQLSKCFYEEKLSRINKIFDNEYLRIRDSRLLWDGTNKLPNILFTVRMFSRDEYRFPTKDMPNGCYPYDVYTIIPESQVLDISGRLYHLNRESSKNFIGRDDFFWEKINQVKKCIDNNNGVGCEKVVKKIADSIAESLREPFQSDSKALADMVYNGGFVRVAMNPYCENGILQINKDTWEAAQIENPGNMDMTDYNRMVYLHYIMDMMAPAGKNNTVLMTPGFVAGYSWCTMAFVIDQSKSFHQRWMDAYHFYHCIYRPLIRRIRKRLKSIFLEEIESLMYHLCFDLKTNRNLPIAEIVKNFNLRSDYLCRVYPFRKVTLSATDEKEDKENQVKIFTNFYYKVSININPYFTKNTAYQFVQNTSYLKALQAGSDAATLSILNSDYS